MTADKSMRNGILVGVLGHDIYLSVNIHEYYGFGESSAVIYFGHYPLDLEVDLDHCGRALGVVGFLLDLSTQLHPCF